jgi:hypothetical protein
MYQNKNLDSPVDCRKLGSDIPGIDEPHGKLWIHIGHNKVSDKQKHDTHLHRRLVKYCWIFDKQRHIQSNSIKQRVT